MTQDQNVVSQKRQHIYEIDLIRGITVLSVVILHSLATTQFLLTDLSQSYFINLLIHLLHYGREIFIFVTGLVLTYSYFGRPFSAKKFWLKRVLLIFIPYVFWSILYVKINNHTVGAGDYFSLLWVDILTGAASYQLYYILLALQLYLIFPWFRLFFQKVVKHPWITLSISFLIQLIFTFIDSAYLQTGVMSTSDVSQFIVSYQDRIFLAYQFFFLLGAFAGVYIDQGYQFLKKFGKFLPLLMIITLILYTIYYYIIVNLSQNIFYATSVFQPSVVIYSTVIIIFFVWLASLWAKQLKLYKLVKLISDVSFGIYFVHVFILALIVKYFLPVMGDSTPIGLKIGLVAVSTIILSILLCVLLLRIPQLSWTIGRTGKKS